MKMRSVKNMKRLVVIGLWLSGSTVAIAGGIRTVQVNDTKMQPINLKMGRASVLRFFDKPTKVVIGNQNYYSIEFVANDLTIQPLGDVETNLFVYTLYHTYGFILRVCHSCRYDDLLYVRWKPKYRSAHRRAYKTMHREGIRGPHKTATGKLTRQRKEKLEGTGKISQCSQVLQPSD